MENTKTSQPILSPLVSTESVKTCRKCGGSFPANTEFFYRNPRGKFGVTPRCKPCVNEDNKASHAARLMRDPDKIRLQANERSKRSYRKNLEESRKKQREFQARNRADPEKNEKIKARKRADGAGLTPDQWNAMFDAQGCRCAICGSASPGSKNGWNTDHCHKTKRVRFILCAHCNRGLGAFKDNPEIMRKAADMIEAINNKPVEAIHD
jgi:hypothetical protein